MKSKNIPPPLCSYPPCINTVTRWRAGYPRRGPRVVDGVKWNWFCSRRCGGLDAKGCMSRELRLRGFRAYLKNKTTARLEALRAALEPFRAAYGDAAGRAMESFILDREAKAERRGYGRAVKRFERGLLKSALNDLPALDSSSGVTTRNAVTDSVDQALGDLEQQLRIAEATR